MKRKAYNLLTECDIKNILSIYYNNENIDKSFKEMSEICGVSERAFSRVLVENGVNTKLKNRYIIENEAYFDEINTENKAYFLGLLFADGYVGNENQIILSLKNIGNTKDVLEVFLSEIKSNLKVIEFDVKSGFKTISTFLKISFSNKHMNSVLKDLGIGSHKELSRGCIPQRIVENGLERHFIRGLYDGDGSVYLKNKHMNTPQKAVTFMGNYNILNQIKNVLEDKLTLNNTKIRNSINSDKICELRYGGNVQADKLKKYLYNNSHIYLKHKAI